MAISGHVAGPEITSALPPKADILGGCAESLLLTQSGHSEGGRHTSAYDPKLTFEKPPGHSKKLQIIEVKHPRGDTL